MNKREFITLLGGAATWPIAARAQQSRMLPTLGYVGSAPRLGENPRDAALLQRLSQLGWIEGRTIAIEYRWAENRFDRYPEIAAEFARLKVAVIVTFGTAVPAFKQATSVIPIVFTIDADPVGRGLVASLARPGGNVTGLSLQSTDLVGKRVELLNEAFPGVRRLGAMGNANFPGAVQEVQQAAAAGHALGIDVVPVEIRRAEDIAPAIDAFKSQVDALYICGDLLTFTSRVQIGALAIDARLPTVSGTRELVEAATLMSYGVNYVDMYRRAADYVDKILRGAKPADLPVEQPTKFDLVINLTTAKALRLKIPESFLVRADVVIE